MSNRARLPHAQRLHARAAARSRGFTLIELVVVIVILGILAAVALPKFVDVGADARTASIKALAGTVKTGIGLVRSTTAIRGEGTPAGIAQLTFVDLDGSTQLRVWNGYPDRWCDGIGAVVQGATVPSGGCYHSAAAVPGPDYTFYGFGNDKIPGGDAGWRIESAPTPAQCSVQYTYGGDAGWRIESAPTPAQCSVQYTYGGTGTPVVTTNTSGC